jgi:hypothetical protein
MEETNSSTREVRDEHTPLFPDGFPAIKENNMTLTLNPAEQVLYDLGNEWAIRAFYARHHPDIVTVSDVGCDNIADVFFASVGILVAVDIKEVDAEYDYDSCLDPGDHDSRFTED